MRIPKEGDIWEWYPDPSKSHEYYGPGICIGYLDSMEGVTGPKGYITFHFANRGVVNIPIEMVRIFMHHIV